VGLNSVLDTNIVLYYLRGELAEPLTRGSYCVSVITELELLSYPDITPEYEEAIRKFLQRVEIVELTPEIQLATIVLRRALRIRLPDAIIAATAQVLDFELLTNDQKLLRSNLIQSRRMILRTS
jgi:predicted nucleic acid-binding protein